VIPRFKVTGGRLEWIAAFFNNVADGPGSPLEPGNIAAVDKELPEVVFEWKYAENFGCFI